MYGHEFHYSGTDAVDARFMFDAERGDGIEDGLEGSASTKRSGCTTTSIPSVEPSIRS